MHVAAIDVAFHPAARADKQEFLDVGLLGKRARDVDIGGDHLALDRTRWPMRIDWAVTSPSTTPST
ncbi:MAG: hypothetical protein WBF49_06985, partial [Methyloceanibacter sp.]